MSGLSVLVVSSWLADSAAILHRPLTLLAVTFSAGEVYRATVVMVGLWLLHTAGVCAAGILGVTSCANCWVEDDRTALV